MLAVARIVRDNSSTTTTALVDSGATASIFHADFAEDLGIEDVESGEQLPFYGISGDNCISEPSTSGRAYLVDGNYSHGIGPVEGAHPMHHKLRRRFTPTQLGADDFLRADDVTVVSWGSVQLQAGQKTAVPLA